MNSSKTSCRDLTVIDHDHGHICVRNTLDLLGLNLRLLGVPDEQVFDYLLASTSLLGSWSDFDLVFVGLDGRIWRKHWDGEQEGVFSTWMAGQFVELRDV